MRVRIPEGELKAKVHKIAGRFAFLLQREIIKRVPRRFRNRIAVNERGGVWTVGTNDEIFKFWEKGTKAHDINPQMSSALRFEWPDHPPELPPSLDGFHYFKRVRHPGTKGKRILEEIANDRPLIRRLLNEAIKSS